MRLFKQGLNAHKVILFVFFVIIFLNLRVTAQETVTNEKQWNFLTDVYLLLPSIDGETGVGENLIVPINADPGDIFSHLKMAGMFYFEARNNKWALTSDLVFMKLGEEVTPGTLFYSGDVAMKQFIWEAAALYRLTSFWEAGVGGRLNNLNVDIDAMRNVLPAGTEEVSGSQSATWFDPVIITRLATDIKDKWLFQFRGDVGGFGIGSDITWQLQAYTGYRFTKVFQVTAGYRFLSMDYNKEIDGKQFVFDVNESGPVVRFGFNF